MRRGRTNVTRLLLGVYPKKSTFLPSGPFKS